MTNTTIARRPNHRGFNAVRSTDSGYFTEAASAPGYDVTGLLSSKEALPPVGTALRHSYADP